MDKRIVPWFPHLLWAAMWEPIRPEEVWLVHQGQACSLQAQLSEELHLEWRLATWELQVMTGQESLKKVKDSLLLDKAPSSNPLKKEIWIALMVVRLVITLSRTLKVGQWEEWYHLRMKTPERATISHLSKDETVSGTTMRKHRWHQDHLLRRISFYLKYLTNPRATSWHLQQTLQAITSHQDLELPLPQKRHFIQLEVRVSVVDRP